MRLQLIEAQVLQALAVGGDPALDLVEPAMELPGVAVLPSALPSMVRMLAISIGLGFLIGAVVVGAASLTLWMK